MPRIEVRQLPISDDFGKLVRRILDLGPMVVHVYVGRLDRDAYSGRDFPVRVPLLSSSKATGRFSAALKSRAAFADAKCCGCSPPLGVRRQEHDKAALTQALEVRVLWICLVTHSRSLAVKRTTGAIRITDPEPPSAQRQALCYSNYGGVD